MELLILLTESNLAELCQNYWDLNEQNVITTPPLRRAHGWQLESVHLILYVSVQQRNMIGTKTYKRKTCSICLQPE